MSVKDDMAAVWDQGFEAGRDAEFIENGECCGGCPISVGCGRQQPVPTNPYRDAGNTTLAFLLTLATLCAVAWFAIDNVPGVVEAMTVGVLRILGYGVGGCVGVAMSWRWIERAL